MDSIKNKLTMLYVTVLSKPYIIQSANNFNRVVINKLYHICTKILFFIKQKI